MRVVDDIKEWCGNDIGYRRRAAQDRNKLKEIVKCALNTYGMGSLPMKNDDDNDNRGVRQGYRIGLCHI